jgi:hypothetical protein
MPGNRQQGSIPAEWYKQSSHQTSTVESPADSSRDAVPVRSERWPPHRACMTAIPKLAGHSTGAMDSAARGNRCYGCHVVELYNGGRPHMSLGPGVPDPPATMNVIPKPSSRHRRGESYAVRAASVLGGLHHEYSLPPADV